MGHLAEALEVSVFVAYRRDHHVPPEPGAVRANVPTFCLHAPLLLRPLQQPRREVELDVLGRVKRDMCWPMISAARYPLIRSAPAFQVATRPAGSSMKIA